jgi:hypothetical protein
MKTFRQIREDGVVATNNVGAGAIAGTGIPPGPGNGEPPGPNSVMMRKKKEKVTNILSRKNPE